MSRKRKPPKEHDLVCPECGAKMRLRPSRYGLFYGCETFPICRSTHGAHPNGQPLGHPATVPTKRARMVAHSAFDKLWNPPGTMTRAEAYMWMERALGLTDDEAHIGKFDEAMCARLLDALGKIGVFPDDDAARVKRAGVSNL